MPRANEQHKQPATNVLARILFVGDVVGPLGLETAEALLPRLCDQHSVDFVVANGENAFANGAGIDNTCAGRLLAAGVDVITTGNHAYDAPDATRLLASDVPIIRPTNLAGSGSGRASIVVEHAGIRLGVVNVIGANEGVAPIAGCADARDAVDAMCSEADLILVDVHASWPAEKLALAWTLDGQVCAVLGTHTHVPTADARLLPNGTAYISDVGMTGAQASLIGFHPDDMLRQIHDADAPAPAPITDGDGILMAVLVTATTDGRASNIERITGRYPNDHQQTPAAAVFDCDGLLIDSAACWQQAYERVLGRPLNPELLADLNGASVPDAAATLGVPVQRLQAALHEAFATGPLTSRPGAHELLARLDGRLPIAVATNAPRDLAVVALDRVGLSPYLPIIVSADGGPGKPAPDVYLAACTRLGVPPHRAVAVEDSPTGATAAQAAGMRLIYIPSVDPGAVTADVHATGLNEHPVFNALGL